MSKKVLGASLGAIILIGVIVAGILIYNNQSKTPKVVINGLVGGEKIELFENEAFKKIAQEKYHTTIEYSKSGSIEMADRDLTNMDYLFPSSQVAGELIKNKQGSLITKSETVLNSPDCLYFMG